LMGQRINTWRPDMGVAQRLYGVVAHLVSAEP
jgi:hypothetical protein